MSSQPQAQEELVDVIDEQGQIVATVTRGEIRRRRLPHRCTYILVFNHRGDLFIHLRTASKDVNPSHWDVAVGGIPAAGESFDAAARRELHEELGIDATPEPLFPFHYEDAASIVRAVVYRLTHDGPFRLQKEEIVRGEFVPVVDMESRLNLAKFCLDGIAVWQEYQRRSL
jgi:isopentenyldiphosphate isomerase